jgi:multiple sugar transport system permease protein
MRGRRLIVGIATHAVLVVACLAAIFPLLWVLLTSFKRDRDTTSGASNVFDFAPTLGNYAQLFSSPTFASAAQTSVLVTVVTTLVVVGIATLGAYGFARLAVPGRRTLASIMVMVQVIPGIVLIIPLYKLVSAVGLYDNPLSLILVMTGLSIPFATWLMLAYIRSFPVEVEEAAVVDGANRFQLFRYVLVPMIAPGIATAAIFTAIAVWNVFLIPVVLAQARAQTLTVFVAQFVTQQQIEWGYLSATGVVILAPIVIFVLALQRPLVKGITAGSLKS